MLMVLHLDYSICYSLFGQFVPDYTFDASVNLSEEEIKAEMKTMMLLGM